MVETFFAGSSHTEEAMLWALARKRGASSKHAKGVSPVIVKQEIAICCVLFLVVMLTRAVDNEDLNRKCAEIGATKA